MVGSTGLKPAPYGLKGRRSVTRAPSHYIVDLKLRISDWFLVCTLRRVGWCTIRNLKSAIDNGCGCGGRIRTFAGRINSAVPYRLATPQEKDEGGRWKDERDGTAPSFILHPSTFILAFGRGGGI